MVPPCIPLPLFILFHFLLKRFPVEHIRLGTALDDSPGIGGELRTHFPVDPLFLRQFNRQHPLDVFQHTGIIAPLADQRALLHRLENDVGKMADFIFAQHNGDSPITHHKMMPRSRTSFVLIMVNMR